MQLVKDALQSRLVAPLVTGVPALLGLQAGLPAVPVFCWSIHSMLWPQVMIRAGFTDASLEAEAKQLVAAAEAVRLADHGTESVLLLAVQAELEQLTAAHQLLAATNQQLQLEVQQLRSG